MGRGQSFRNDVSIPASSSIEFARETQGTSLPLGEASMNEKPSTTRSLSKTSYRVGSGVAVLLTS